MADNNSFKNNIEALVSGIDGYLNTKSVVGEAITVKDNIILPLADISFGLGAGTFGSADKNNGGGGMGAKITPTAVVVVNGDCARVLSLKDNPGILEKIIDMAPGIISKFTNKNSGDSDAKAAEEIFE